MSFVNGDNRITAAHSDVSTADTLSEPTRYETVVRLNIQQIRTNLQSIQQNLANLKRNLISRRIVESLHEKLRETFNIVVQTEQTFKQWMQQQQSSGNIRSAEKQRDKLLFGKLFSHFQNEIKHVQELSERVREAAQRATDDSFSQKRTGGIVLDLENAGIYEERDDDTLLMCEEQKEFDEFDRANEEDTLLSRTVAEERYHGISRIHNQVSQANQIFRDLANLIFSQGETINSIERQMQDAHSHAKNAVVELNHTRRMQQRSRQRRCIFMLFVFAIVFFILYSLNIVNYFFSYPETPIVVQAPTNTQKTSSVPNNIVNADIDKAKVFKPLEP